MTQVITSAICLSEFAILKSAIDDWNEDDSESLRVQYAGENVKAFSRKLESAVELFLNNTADQGKKVDPDARETLIEIDRLSAVYEDFKRLAAEESPYAPPYGSSELWSAWHDLVEHFKNRPHYPRPQAIETLLSQKVGQMQIATIYGWFTDKGAPDVEKVAEEMKTPGTHYIPATWIHPARASKQRLIDAEWRQRSGPRAAKFETPVLEEEFQKFVPPSLDEMVRLGAPASQIANVHRISVAEAEQLLIEAGTEAKREIVPANPAVAHLERMMEEANRVSPPPAPTPPSRPKVTPPAPSPIVPTAASESKLLQEV